MSHKKRLTGILALLSTAALATFYWIEFFPSQYWIQLGLMGGLWGVQVISVFYWIKWTTVTMIEGRGILWWGLGILLVFLSLLYCIGSATPDPNRELVDARVVDGKQLELYYLDRHDHTALELFYGPKGWLAQRYVRDHFTIQKIEVIDNSIHIRNSLQTEELQLNLATMEVIFKSDM